MPPALGKHQEPRSSDQDERRAMSGGNGSYPVVPTASVSEYHEITQRTIEISKSTIDISRRTTDISQRTTETSHRTIEIRVPLILVRKTTEISQRTIEISPHRQQLTSIKLRPSTSTSPRSSDQEERRRVVVRWQ